MATQYERGHAKNVANLLKFNQHIATLGLTYNPANTIITATALATLHTTANTLLTNVNLAYNSWKKATNDREIAFLPLDKLSTQLLGALQSTSASTQTVNDMVSLVRKLRGDGKLTKGDAGITEDQVQAIPNPTPAPEAVVTISNSQRSFDNKLQHFSKIILLLQSVPSYAPNEVPFQVASLQTLFNNLTLLNNAANVSYANLKAARIARNLTFYAADTGMLDRIRKAKSYIKSLFGASSQQFAAAKDIKFFRVVSKKKAK
ncbi:MAG: hypothetical protein HYX39_02080 [Bacteroidetes bacterium]|nr:hypothetical protein [Bacteroidota bacterium]